MDQVSPDRGSCDLGLLLEGVWGRIGFECALTEIVCYVQGYKYFV